jgi:hypothetical protein
MRECVAEKCAIVLVLWLWTKGAGSPIAFALEATTKGDQLDTMSPELVKIGRLRGIGSF